MWKEDPAIGAASRFYLPDRCAAGTDAITIAPSAKGFTVGPAGEGSKALYIEVPSSGQALERRLAVKW